jgi:LmbE family N-acetylglucosaminyl deacetylase
MNIAGDRILVVAAHPDDEALGCGGTMARLAKEGREVRIMIMGQGLHARGEATTEAMDRLHAQATVCANELGAAISFRDFPDNRFDSVALIDIVKAIEQEIDAFGPQTVLTHDGTDLNIDHHLLHRAVVTATRPVGGGHNVKAVLTFEVPSSTEWAFDQFGTFRPAVFVDISETLETKISALACYEDEMRPFPHPRSPELIRALATMRGASAGYKAAEAFDVVRILA